MVFLGFSNGFSLDFLGAFYGVSRVFYGFSTSFF